MSKYYELSEEERMAALEKAKKMRKARAQVKDDIANGKITMQELIAQKDDEVIGKLKVAEVIESFPGIGPTKRERIMAEIGISDTRRIRGLGIHQQNGLLARFE